MPERDFSSTKREGAVLIHTEVRPDVSSYVFRRSPERRLENLDLVARNSVTALLRAWATVVAHKTAEDKLQSKQINPTPMDEKLIDLFHIPADRFKTMPMVSESGLVVGVRLLTDEDVDMGVMFEHDGSIRIKKEHFWLPLKEFNPESIKRNAGNSEKVLEHIIPSIKYGQGGDFCEVMPSKLRPSLRSELSFDPSAIQSLRKQDLVNTTKALVLESGLAGTSEQILQNMRFSWNHEGNLSVSDQAKGELFVVNHSGHDVKKSKANGRGQYVVREVYAPSSEENAINEIDSRLLSKFLPGLAEILNNGFLWSQSKNFTANSIQYEKDGNDWLIKIPNESPVLKVTRMGRVDILVKEQGQPDSWLHLKSTKQLQVALTKHLLPKDQPQAVVKDMTKVFDITMLPVDQITHSYKVLTELEKNKQAEEVKKNLTEPKKEEIVEENPSTPVIASETEVKNDKAKKGALKKLKILSRKYSRDLKKEAVKNESAIYGVIGVGVVTMLNLFASQGDVQTAQALNSLLQVINTTGKIAAVAGTSFHPLLYWLETKYAKDPSKRTWLKSFKKLSLNLAALGLGTSIAGALFDIVNENEGEKDSQGMEASMENGHINDNTQNEVPAVEGGQSPEVAQPALQVASSHTPVISANDYEATEFLDNAYHEQLGSGDWVNTVDNNGQDLSNVVMDKTFEYLADNKIDLRSLDLADLAKNPENYLTSDQLENINGIRGTATYDQYLQYLSSN